MNTVTITSDNGFSVTILLDETSPYLTDGYSGWETVDRPRRTAMTRFKGHQPYRQQIDVMFDGNLDHESQESKIQTLIKMTESNPNEQPPTVKIDGLALFTGRTWVIEDLIWDNQKTMWEMFGETPGRTRQSCSIRLMEFVDDDVLVTNSKPTIVAGGAAAKTTQEALMLAQGLSAKQLAQQKYGNPDFWTWLQSANPWITDPRAPIPGTQTVVTPPGPPKQDPFGPTNPFLPPNLP